MLEFFYTLHCRQWLGAELLNLNPKLYIIF
jgi:hypothetical protein